MLRLRSDDRFANRHPSAQHDRHRCGHPLCSARRFLDGSEGGVLFRVLSLKRGRRSAFSSGRNSNAGAKSKMPTPSALRVGSTGLRLWGLRSVSLLAWTNPPAQATPMQTLFRRQNSAAPIKDCMGPSSGKERPPQDDNACLGASLIVGRRPRRCGPMGLGRRAAEGGCPHMNPKSPALRSGIRGCSRLEVGMFDSAVAIASRSTPLRSA